jgi:hypothetical protein
MRPKYLIISGLFLVLLAALLVACSGKSTPCPAAAPCPTAEKCPTCPEATKCPEPTKCPDCPPAPTQAPCPTAEPCPACLEAPFQADWAGSGHADKEAMAFNDWNDTETKQVPATCAKCHSTPGFLDFIGADGTEAGKVDNPAPIGTVITCDVCHNPVSIALTEVTFPSGAVISNLGPEARCMTCHQGRESKVSVDKQINDTFKVTDVDAVVAPIKDDKGNDVIFGFRNIHYKAAAATMYGDQAKGGYQYDGKAYDVKFAHTEGMDTCIDCHNQHTLQLRLEKCQICHGDNGKSVETLVNIREPSSSKDYDGDGDVTEGIAKEITGLQEILYGSLQAYAKEVAGTPLVYDGNTYPYFLVAGADGAPAKDDKGATIAYNAWTARMLKAAYNYQVSIKDPGAFAHGGKYIIELLYDSIEDVNASEGLTTKFDVATLTREDSGHFDGAAPAWRHWDLTAEGAPSYVVEGGCAKCHSAAGLPQFLKEGVNTSQPAGNGLSCLTCHDEAAGFPARRAVTSVVMPSGKTVTFSPDDQTPADSNLCVECHQGRSSKKAVDAAIAKAGADPITRPMSAHYLPAAAVWFGTDAQVAYEYDGQTYVGANTHMADPTKPGCVGCHDVHGGGVKTELCMACHGGIQNVDDIRSANNTTDWDGDGDVKEGVRNEYRHLRDALYIQIQAYAKDTVKTAIIFDSNAYPYWFIDANGDGKHDADETTGYNVFDAALLKATYNYGFFANLNPGVGAHNWRYAVQIIYDTIKDLGGNVTKYTRP